jgi:hypothetical protein
VAVSFIGGVHAESHQPVASHWQTLSISHNVVSSTPRHERGSNSQWTKDLYSDQDNSADNNLDRPFLVQL